MTKEIIATLNIKRENSFLYVLGTNEQGYLTVIKVTRGKQGRPRKDPVEAFKQENNGFIKEIKQEEEINWDE